ncbi:ATP-binding cassette domain-containing protein [Embleya sp. NPDC050493]|uniref:ATP-binding cassette domain-containing protein n=1 Tax=Embleya sp. NPDC050493 TaxID=3363989 RepID=UPI0037A61D26
MTDLLDITDPAVEFRQGRGIAPLRAVDGASPGIGAGETVGLVGESGSGKSTIGRAVLGLNPVHSEAASGSRAWTSRTPRATPAAGLRTASRSSSRTRPRR